MHYYMLQPFYLSDGRHIDTSIGQPYLSNIVEEAYWALFDDVNVYDKKIKDYSDFFIFDNLDALKKAADILEHHEIQFKTNIIEKTSVDEADYITADYYYKLLVPNQPEVDGAGILNPQIYTEE